MPLVLSLKDGEDFYVGEDQLVVSDLTEDGSGFTIKSKEGAFAITERRSEEVLSEVFVSAGNFPAANMVKVVIDAPAHQLILRGDKKRSGRPRPVSEAV